MDEYLWGLRYYDIRDNLAHDLRAGRAPQNFEGMVDHIRENANLTRSQAFEITEKFVSDLRRSLKLVR